MAELNDNNFDTDAAVKELYNLSTVIMIELGRIYDLLSILANAQDPGKFKSLTELHEQGKIMAPPPALAVDDG